MSLLETLRTLPVTEALGWALLHSLWQGAVIALLCAVAFRLLRHRSANARYLVGCAGLALIALAPVLTMTLTWPTADASAAGSSITVAAIAGWSERLEPFFPALSVLWLIGVLGLQVRLVLHWSHAQHLKHCGTRLAPANWQATVNELSDEMGVTAGVRLLESSLARVPMMIGWLEPVILVPATSWTGLTPDQLRSILVHELTHIRRHDYVVNLLQTILETLLFYHPAVWWLSGRIRTEREYCCDDVAVSMCGDPLCYAKALSSLDDMRCDDLETILASTGGSLMDRIRRIVGARPLPTRRLGGWLAPLAIMLSVATVSAVALGMAAADDRTDAKLEPIDRVDLTGILREMQFDQTDMIEFLSEAGIDNGVLLVVLEELGADDKVFEVIDRAAARADYVESRMSRYRESVSDMLASGDMTLNQAEQHLDMARRELLDRYRAEQRQDATDLWFQDDLLALPDAQHEKVVLDLLSEGEAEEHPRRVEVEAKMKWWGDDAWTESDTAVEVDLSFVDETTRELEMMEVEYATLDAQVADAMAAGRLTDAEAEARLHEAAVNLDTIRAQLAKQRHNAEARDFTDQWHERPVEYVVVERLPAAAEGEAAQRLVELEVALVDRETQWVRLQDERAAIKELLHEGDLTEEDAAEKLYRLERHLAQAEVDRVDIETRVAQHGAGRDRLLPPEQRVVDATEAIALDRSRLLQAVTDVLVTDSPRIQWKRRHARHTLTDADRKALMVGLKKARARLAESMESGTISSEDAEKSLARLVGLQRRLERKQKRDAMEAESATEAKPMKVKPKESAPLEVRKKKVEGELDR